jgi:serine/threonine protein kinase
MNSDSVLKVCDFGLSRFIEQTLAATMTACGTPSWTAPEVLRNERYDHKIDIFSFGVVIWELFARQDPYPNMPPFQIVFAVGNQHARPQINPHWPAAWVKLITDCWDEDPDARPSFDDILVRLQSINQ